MKKLIFTAFIALNLAFADETLDEFENEYKSEYVSDPLSGYNRAITGFNDAFYGYLVTPLAKGYDYALPDPVQGAIYNAFYNILYPTRLINSILQWEFDKAWDETKRFFINTTMGFAGFSDVASMHLNMPKHDEDFGQTLGAWGVPKGPHIVWPILGPSNFRDTVGMVGDYFTNPLSYTFPHTDFAATGLKAYGAFNEFSLDPDQYNNIKKDALDLYIVLRDGYEQRRDYLVNE